MNGPTYRLHTHWVLGRSEPEGALPVLATQLEDKCNYAAVQAPTDGYQDTIATSPTTTAVPQVANSLSPATRLKHKLQHTTDFIVCPGVYDGLSARIAQAVGFETLYMVWKRLLSLLRFLWFADTVADRSRLNCVDAWYGRPGHRLAHRHGTQRRHDRQPRSPPLRAYSRYGHRLWR